MENNILSILEKSLIKRGGDVSKVSLLRQNKKILTFCTVDFYDHDTQHS